MLAPARLPRCAGATRPCLRCARSPDDAPMWRGPSRPLYDSGAGPPAPYCNAARSGPPSLRSCRAAWRWRAADRETGGKDALRALIGREGRGASGPSLS